MKCTVHLLYSCPAHFRLFGNESFDRILDIGTGNCYSAFVYGEEYPDAEVYGIELAAPYVRYTSVSHIRTVLLNLVCMPVFY